MLTLYKEYSREEVHDIFSPDSTFTPQAGTWGLQGIVSIPERNSDYVFFVTFGQSQSGHLFDEYITKDGVLTWQSQPQQNFNSTIIQELINHDEDKNSIYLFLRTKGGIKYTYLGKLKYLTHNNERENPVYFKWQILEWDGENEIINQMGLFLREKDLFEEEQELEIENIPQGKLILVKPPEKYKNRIGKNTVGYRKPHRVDYSKGEVQNKKLGLLGELSVVDFEKKSLREVGRIDLEYKVKHVAQIEGDGAGYDILSYDENGNKKYIEVKTTVGDANSDFYLTYNELMFSKQKGERYYLYRVYQYDKKMKSGKLFVLNGDMENVVNLTPVLFKATR